MTMHGMFDKAAIYNEIANDMGDREVWICFERLEAQKNTKFFYRYGDFETYIKNYYKADAARQILNSRDWDNLKYVRINSDGVTKVFRATYALDIDTVKEDDIIIPPEYRLYGGPRPKNH